MVKIRRLLIENFTILKEVMGKDKIELNFSDNMLCLIIGKNGSGKSFLMSLFTPSTQDSIKNRTGSMILKGKTGRKEIDIELDQKYLYKCVIIYGTKNSCFIHKYNLYTDEDLGELNPNGNVNTYYDVLDKELGWSKNYLNVGYLSSGITSLINMKPAERNDYIAVWLPELSEFIDSYKHVVKKSNVLKKQIDLLNNDIGKLTSVDYDIIINNYEESLINLENLYHKYMNDETKCKMFINLIPNSDIEELRTRIKSLLTLSKLLKSERDEILAEQELISQYSGKSGKKLLETTINKYGNEINILSEKLKNIENNIMLTQSEMNEIKSNNDNFENETTLSEIENTLKIIDADIEDMEITKKSILKYNPDYIELENIENNIVDNLISIVEDSLLDLRDKILSLVPLDMIQNIDVLSNDNNKIDELIDLYKKEIEILDKKTMNISNKIYSLKNSDYNKELLKLKPENCNMVCGIVNELLLYVNPEKEIDKLQDELKNIISEKTEISNKLESVENDKKNILTSVNLLTEMNNKIMKSISLIIAFPENVRIYFEEKDSCTLLNKLPDIRDILNSYKEFIYLNNRLKTAIESKNNNLVIYKLMKQKKNMDEKWLKLNDQYKNLYNDRLKIIEDFEYNENIYKKLENIRNLSEKNIERINEYNIKADDLLKEKELLIKMNKYIYYKNRLKDILRELEIKINSTKISLDETRSKLEIAKNKKNSIKTLMESRDNIIKKKNLYDMLSFVWSPKTGYPSWEMEDFLDLLTEQTNSDLSKMWGSELKIESFDIGPSEFNIIVNRDGVLIKDASECSDGERATLSLAISFAIIEINLRFKKYNVLRFDEVDGPLDSERRRTFCETILDRLPALDCGNLFMTTHNNEFSGVTADIIILKGAEEDPSMLINKNVVYHY